MFISPMLNVFLSRRTDILIPQDWILFVKSSLLFISGLPSVNSKAYISNAGRSLDFALTSLRTPNSKVQKTFFELFYLDFKAMS